MLDQLKKEKKMKRSLALVGIIGLVVAFSVFSVMGCAKKAVVQEETVSMQEAAPAVVDDSAADKAKEVAAMKEKAAQEEAARLLAEKEKAMKEAAASAAKEEKTLLDINFDFDQYTLKPEARDILKGNAAWLTKKTGSRLTIEGNCDERGTTEYNLALGQRRAEEAKKFLVELGIDEKIIKTISYGKEKPLDPGQNEEAWAKNRRDHFVVEPQK
jgi:peptidoglycan-associated lipoprotein